MLLEFHPKAIRDSIHKREVGGDEGHIQNGPVAPAGLAKNVDILLSR